MNWTFTRVYVICYSLFLWGGGGGGGAGQSYGPSTKGGLSFFKVGACWNTLLLRIIAILCQSEILANKYPCVYSLPQKALILFSKLFLCGALELQHFE